MTENIYKVPKKQWSKWNDSGKEMFNSLLEKIMNLHGNFLHPKTPEMPHEEWQTVAWNAAWLAASITTEQDND